MRVMFSTFGIKFNSCSSFNVLNLWHVELNSIRVYHVVFSTFSTLNKVKNSTFDHVDEYPYVTTRFYNDI